MAHEPQPVERVEQVIASQRRYYDLRAPDDADISRPSDRRGRGLLDASTVRRVVDELAPTGNVLELASGTGAFTRELARHARSLTCLDGSPRMLELNRQIVGDPRIEYVCADIFDWQPQHLYDVVFFGFWLSHVPPTRFDDFWSLVETCLAPGGRVGFVDEDERAASLEASRSSDDVPTARRRLGDGRTFDIVKVFWNEADLQRRLSRGGWRAEVQPLAATCLHGVATRP